MKAPAKVTARKNPKLLKTVEAENKKKGDSTI